MKWTRYILALIVTIAIFFIAFSVSGMFANKKIDEVRAIQDKISTDILSIETRFALLGSTSCEHVVANDDFEKGLTDELNMLANQVKFMESERGAVDPDVLLIKEKYNLLQIKDYLLMKDLGNRCNRNITSILYFHSQDCSDCKKESIILDELHNKYPEVRIYWIDKDFSTPAIETIISMFHVKETPSIFLAGKLKTGLVSIEDITKMLPKEIVNPKPVITPKPKVVPTDSDTPATDTASTDLSAKKDVPPETPAVNTDQPK